MKEYIDKSALLETMSRNSITEKITFADGKSIIETVREFPAADVVERKRGEWVQVNLWATKAKYRCSVCGREIMSATKVNIEKYPFCHCGADMREVTHD